jgi:hypothetical protein
MVPVDGSATCERRATCEWQPRAASDD